jgi:hypothetical protein
VLGSQVRLQASGCAAHTGGSVRKPPTVGPAGVCMTYGGDGGAVGSAPAVPGAPTTKATAAAARTMFLTVGFIMSTFAGLSDQGRAVIGAPGCEYANAYANQTKNRWRTSLFAGVHELVLTCENRTSTDAQERVAFN